MDRLAARFLAPPARFGADATSGHDHLLVAAGPPRRDGARRQADVGTIEIEANALPQLVDHLFADAGVRAGRAALRARKALFDTADERVVGVALNLRVG